ncbi:MAG: CaiB/BaiF CoA transferase family protein [Acidimicrobiales bacterium]
MSSPAPLAGLKVIELAHWVAGPAAGGVLSDWGAEVIKVEPPGGEPMRHLFAGAAAATGAGAGSDPDLPPQAPSFVAVNRNKRSVEIDLTEPNGMELFERLLAGADILLTNLRPQALEKMGLAPEAVAARQPSLIYCSVTAYGWQGPDREQAGYDLAGFFARSGVLHQITTRNGAPPPLMNGMGDMFTAMSAVAGILAAVVERQQTGKGRFVEASLLRTGMWAIAGELGVVAGGGRAPAVAPRHASPTPLFNVYRAADDKWFVLVGVEADRHLPTVLGAVDRAGLLADERFANARSVTRNREAFIAELDAVFATRPLAEWAEIFARHDVWWAPVQSPADVATDAQAHAAGGWSTIAGSDRPTVDAPIRFDGQSRGTVPDAPRAGQHNAEIRTALAGSHPQTATGPHTATATAGTTTDPATATAATAAGTEPGLATNPMESS